MSWYNQQAENLRVIGDYELRRTDPYGFWIIRKAKGPTPKVFQDETFTNTQMAVRFLQNYLDRQVGKKSVTKADEEL